MSGTSALRPDGAPGLRLQEQGRDLTPQEWEDFIRQNGTVYPYGDAGTLQ